MEVFLFCYGPLQFPTKAIFIPIELMDVGMLEEIEKIIQRADENGHLIDYYTKFAEGGGLESLNKYQDIADILLKWTLYAEDRPSSWQMLFGAEKEMDTKIPEWYKKSFFHYGGFKHREIFEELKNMTVLEGEKVIVKHAILYQHIIMK